MVSARDTNPTAVTPGHSPRRFHRFAAPDCECAKKAVVTRWSRVCGGGGEVHIVVVWG